MTDRVTDLMNSIELLCEDFQVTPEGQSSRTPTPDKSTGPDEGCCDGEEGGNSDSECEPEHESKNFQQACPMNLQRWSEGSNISINETPATGPCRVLKWSLSSEHKQPSCCTKTVGRNSWTASSITTSSLTHVPQQQPCTLIKPEEFRDQLWSCFYQDIHPFRRLLLPGDNLGDD